MTRLYQWLRERTTIFHAESWRLFRAPTIRTEVTEHWQERTLLFCGHVTSDGVSCPLCGHALAAAGTEEEKVLRLPGAGLLMNEEADRHSASAKSMSDPERLP